MYGNNTFNLCMYIRVWYNVTIMNNVYIIFAWYYHRFHQVHCITNEIQKYIAFPFISLTFVAFKSHIK